MSALAISSIAEAKCEAACADMLTEAKAKLIEAARLIAVAGESSMFLGAPWAEECLADLRAVLHDNSIDFYVRQINEAVAGFDPNPRQPQTFAEAVAAAARASREL